MDETKPPLPPLSPDDQASLDAAKRNVWREVARRIAKTLTSVRNDDLPKRNANRKPVSPITESHTSRVSWETKEAQLLELFQNGYNPNDIPGIASALGIKERSAKRLLIKHGYLEESSPTKPHISQIKWEETENRFRHLQQSGFDLTDVQAVAAQLGITPRSAHRRLRVHGYINPINKPKRQRPAQET